MALYLDYTAKEPEKLMKLIEESKLPSWEKKTLLGKIQSDIDETTKRHSCEHEFVEWIGAKTSCRKCDGMITGIAVSWARVVKIVTAAENIKKSLLVSCEGGERTTH